jgi:FKBP-type peptidyl-prolyl cis-trans isomerase (trigger factor)
MTEKIINKAPETEQEIKDEIARLRKKQREIREAQLVATLKRRDEVLRLLALRLIATLPPGLIDEELRSMGSTQEYELGVKEMLSELTASRQKIQNELEKA